MVAPIFLYPNDQQRHKPVFTFVKGSTEKKKNKAQPADDSRKNPAREMKKNHQTMRCIEVHPMTTKRMFIQKLKMKKAEMWKDETYAQSIHMTERKGLS